MSATLTELQRTQRRYINERWTPPPWIARRDLTPLADYVRHSTLVHCRELLPEDLSKRSLLVVNCGSGVDTHFFFTEGFGRVCVTDLAERVVRLAHVNNPGVIGASAATEQLPFNDESFDFVGVRSGLHHLDDPYEGLREMARVARLGVFFIEGQRSPLVPLFVRLGLLEDAEEAGNTVYRFTRNEIYERLSGLGFSQIVCMTGFFMQFPWLMQVSNRVRARWAARAFRLLVQTINAAVGRWGNAFIVVAWKPASQAR